VNHGKDRAAVEGLVAAWEQAGSAADGDAFGSRFDQDADWVDIYGQHGRGRERIARVHTTIFRTVYAGSAARYSVPQVRMPSDSLALAQVSSRPNAPGGPLAGEHQGGSSHVMRRQGVADSGFRIPLIGNIPDLASDAT
jgi:uncharacterized protein (TIGR02246 family)